MAKVYHSEIYGLRETKYDWLNKHNIKNVKWNKLEPNSEFYLFIPQDQRMLKSYQAFTKITEVFPINSVGIATSRDGFVIDIDEKALRRKMEMFINKSVPDHLLKETYKLKENKNWKLSDKRNIISKTIDREKYFTKILYRPFDQRNIFYNNDVVERSRYETMRHMINENVAIITERIIREGNYRHTFVTTCIEDKHSIDILGSANIFPLYLYPETDKKDLFSQHESGEKKPNIKHELFAELKKNFKKAVTPEEIFYYIYAVLYSNTYRKKYAEFLKIDFPRVPFTKDYKLFIQLGKLGQQLADLHLLKSKELDKTISKFPIDGNNKVEKPKYANEKVWINKEQYFDGIKEEVWQYQIGGYQVCQKWLKDRKKRTLTLDEIKTYCKIVTSLSKTIDLQNEIDKYFEEVEKTV